MTGRQLIKQLCESLQDLDSHLPSVVFWNAKKGVVTVEGTLQASVNGLTVVIQDPDKTPRT